MVQASDDKARGLKKKNQFFSLPFYLYLHHVLILKISSANIFKKEKDPDYNPRTEKRMVSLNGPQRNN